MVVGHTKFSSDRFFELFKLKLRKSKVDNLDDLVLVVNNSTVSGYNLAQTIFDKKEKRVVFFYAWTEFLTNYFKPIPSILKQHHFIFSKDNIGFVEIKEIVDGKRQIIDIRKTKLLPIKTGFSHEILSNGLNIERQWYLYEQIRGHI